jgi:hypothetical protein
VQLLEGFAQPVVSNAINLTVSGTFSRRVRVSSSAGFTAGTVGLSTGGGNEYSNWTGAAMLHVTLTRRSAFETQYFWYNHRFGPDVVLAPGLASQLSRQGLRVGVTLFTPLVGHLKG